MTEYVIGAADIKVATLNSGYAPLAFRDVGESKLFEVDQSVDFADNFKTGKTGPNLQDLHIAIKKAATAHLTLTERTLLNLELIVFGESSSEAAGAYAANAAFPAGIVAGETYLIPGGHMGITALVLKDGAGAPVTVDPSKYSVNPDAPFVTFLDVTGFTQPFTAFSYNYVKSDKLTLLSKPTPELCVIADGVNLAVPGERIWARLDRVAFGPAAKFSIKQGDTGGTGSAIQLYELEGPALVIPGNTGYGEHRVY